MLRHVWSVLCTKTVIDVETNNISLFEVIEQLQVRRPLAGKGNARFHVENPFGFQWVSLWTRAEHDKATQGHARDRVFDPSGALAFGGEYEVDLRQKPRTRVRRTVSTVFKASGRYEFCTEVKSGRTWKEVSRIPLTVSVETETEK